MKTPCVLSLSLPNKAANDGKENKNIVRKKLMVCLNCLISLAIALIVVHVVGYQILLGALLLIVVCIAVNYCGLTKRTESESQLRL